MSKVTCQECRELLLTADPEALLAGIEAGEMPTIRAHDASLREHLHGCADCRPLAAALLAQNAALDDALTRLVGATEGEATAPLEGTHLRARTGAPTAHEPVAARPVRRRLRPWQAALIPAVAAAALLLIWRPAPLHRRSLPLPPLESRDEPVPSIPMVNATGASAVAVMSTKNPRITVVWTF